MSGKRLHIRRAKNERRGFPFDQIRGFFDPVWYSHAYDDSGFEKSCPVGYDDKGLPDDCPARDGVNYDCRACEDMPYEETSID